MKVTPGILSAEKKEKLKQAFTAFEKKFNDLEKRVEKAAEKVKSAVNEKTARDKKNDTAS